MALICNDFYFYSNGEYKTKSKWDSKLYTFDNDIQELSTKIRIFGTKEQIDKALNDYTTITGLNLDECYTFEVEKITSQFFNVADNKRIRKKLKDYKKLYNKGNEKTLILRML